MKYPKFYSIFCMVLCIVLLAGTMPGMSYAAAPSGQAAQRTPAKEAAEAASEEYAHDVAEDVSGSMTENASEAVSENSTYDAAEAVSENSTYDAAEAVSENGTYDSAVKRKTAEEEYEKTDKDTDDRAANTAGELTGLLPMEWEYVPFAEAAEDICLPDDIRDNGRSEETVLLSDYYESSWQQYGCYYIYNHLSTEDKKVWDELDALCRAVMDSSEYKSNTGFVSTGRSDQEQVKYIAYMFRYCNPQYFFLKNAIIYTYDKENPDTIYIGLSLYDYFKSGTVRQTAAKNFFEQLQIWVEEVESYDSDLEKILKMQDIICQKVTYDYEFSSLGLEEQKEREKTAFTQSAYSVLCMDKTVCAGYAQAFELLSNAVGIDAIAVTSRGHEWNQVRLYDSWYNLDCTWADKDTYIWQKYTLKSDAYYEKDNNSHSKNSFWTPYVPSCTQDSGFNGRTAPGVLPEGSIAKPEKTMDMPNVQAENVNGTFRVTITGEDAGAAFFYTVNAAHPSSSASKSELYKEPFEVKRGDVIRAVAVRDQYLDSAEAVLTAQPPSYKITYILNGGENDSSNPEYFFEDAVGVIPLADAKRAGYQFLGWYLDEACSEQIREINPAVTRELTLYAGWKINSYTITFQYENKKTKTVNALYGSLLEEPEIPEKKEYVFLGWYNSRGDGSTLWNFAEDAVTGDMTLQAKWGRTVQVVFQPQSGEADIRMEAVEGNILHAPEIKREGYTLIGWYEEASGRVWNFETDRIAGNLVLYARWKADRILVTFDADGESLPYKEKYVTYDTAYGSLPQPEKEGCLFDGWYLAKDETIRICEDSLVKIAENHSLRAKFITQDTCHAPCSDIYQEKVYYGTLLQLHTETEGARIYYTTDGSIPDAESGILYQQPIELTDEQQTILAVAVKAGCQSSGISRFHYQVILYRCDFGDIRLQDLEEYAERIGANVHMLTNDMLPDGLWIAGLEEQVYQGNAVTCPNLQVYYQTKRLQEGQDYTLRYAKNCRPGTASVTVNGKGTYKGKCKGSFVIHKADIRSAAAEPVVCYYKAKLTKGRPQIYMEQNGRMVRLKAGRDYVCEYPGTDKRRADYSEAAFREIGSYTIIVHGKGNYEGTLLVEERIEAVKAPAKAEEDTTIPDLRSWLKQLLRFLYRL